MALLARLPWADRANRPQRDLPHLRGSVFLASKPGAGPLPHAWVLRRAVPRTLRCQSVVRSGWRGPLGTAVGYRIKTGVLPYMLGLRLGGPKGQGTLSMEASCVPGHPELPMAEICPPRAPRKQIAASWDRGPVVDLRVRQILGADR